MKPIFFLILALSAISPVLAAPPATSSTQNKQSSVLNLPDFVTGADVSELAREEQFGAVYKDRGAPTDALAMFKKRGCSVMRLRLWVNPSDQGEMINDLPYTIKLGHRIKADGFKLLLDFHYSDTWADPGAQTTPAAWAGLPFDPLVTKIHDYSESVIIAMRNGGAMPDIVEVGNEINNGILWPSGHVEDPGGWGRLNALLRSAIAGIREGAVSAPEPRIMLHIASGGDTGLADWFFGNLQEPKNGGPIDFDIIGFSYYPDGSRTLEDLKRAVIATSNKYGKPILIAETAFPASSWAIGPQQTVYQTYGRTPEGQAKYLKDLIATVKGAPNHSCIGVLWWAPEWITTPKLRAYANCPLFDSDFNALPAIDALSP